MDCLVVVEIVQQESSACHAPASFRIVVDGRARDAEMLRHNLHRAAHFEETVGLQRLHQLAALVGLQFARRRRGRIANASMRWRIASAPAGSSVSATASPSVLQNWFSMPWKPRNSVTSAFRHSAAT